MVQFLCPLQAKFCTMKKLVILSAICGVFTTEAWAQENTKVKVRDADVPEAVRTSFQRQFATADDVSWKMKDGNYKVKFEIDNVDHIAELSSTGELISRGMEVDAATLPDAVNSSVKTMYPNHEIDDVYRIDKDGAMQYLIELDGKPDRMVLLDAQGKVLKDREE